MDHKKKSKRSKVESTNNKKTDAKQNKVKDKKPGKKEKLSDNKDNINQGSNQSFSEDQKDSNNIICKKDSDKYELKQNKAHNINTINLDDNEEGWFVQTKNKKKCIEKQSKFSNTNPKLEKAHDKNNIDSHENEDTCKSITKEGERQRDKNKNKKSQKQSEFSVLDSSIDDTFNQKKVHDGNNINLHEDILNLSKNYDSEEQKNENKTKKKTGPQSLSEEQKYHKKVQNQRKLSDKDSVEDSFKNKVHDEKICGSQKDILKSVIKEREERWNHKNKNNNGQKQSRFSDMETEWNHKNKNNNGQKQSRFSDTETEWNHKNKNNNGQKQSRFSDMVTGWNHKNKNNNGQKQSRFSDTETEWNHKNKNNDVQKQSRFSDTETEWNHKNKNNNGQKQSRFSDIETNIIEEMDEDIFNLPNDYSLAHCVAEDLRMGAGIAVDFKRIFGGVGKLVDQNLKVGDVGIVKRHDQYAFYLVTKKNSSGKPTMITMEKALHSLLKKMKEYNLTKLGIPTIGCGLDKLDWSDTKLLINKIFSGSGIHITVCVPSKLLDPKTTKKLKVYITPNNLWGMEPDTIIILFIDLEQICKKNWTDPIIDAVDAKYPFKENLLRDVKNKKFDPGDISRYNVRNEIIICIFTAQRIYYGSLENGFKQIDKIKNYKYLAIQSGPIDYPSDNFQHISWIVLILRSVIHFAELWLCGDVKQSGNQVFYDEYCKSVQYPMDHSFQYNSPTQKNNRFNDDFRNSFNTK